MSDILMTKSCIGIRYFADMNPWIDFVVFADEKHKSTIRKCILEAIDEFWESDNTCYGDALSKHLLECGLSNKCYILYYEDVLNKIQKLIDLTSEHSSVYQYKDSDKIWEDFLSWIQQQFSISIEIC